MVAKSYGIALHVADLEEVFEEIHKYNMCLNPKNVLLGLMKARS